MNVAHHLHVPAQIVRGCELNVPTILLIRHPVEAVISHRALHREGEIVHESPWAALRMGFAPFFRSWIDFYQTTLRYVDSVVIGLFEDVIDDFGSIVKKVNSKYSTEFSVFDHTDENVSRVNENRGYHAGPSDRRRRLKEQVRVRFEHFRETEGGDVVSKAVELYERYRVEAKEN